MKGVVIQVIPEKGYAFIKGEDNLSRFTHARNVKDWKFDFLKKGTLVEFDHQDNLKGPRAINVRVVS